MHDVFVMEDRPLPVVLRDHLQNVLRKLILHVEQPYNSNDDADYIRFRVENFENMVLRCNAIYRMQADFLKQIQECTELARFDSSVLEETRTGYKAPKEKTGNNGRPRYIIMKEQLEFYIENGFTVPSISKMIRVSPKTVRRRLKKFRLSMQGAYTQISNDELDAVIKEILGKNPNCGYRRMLGFLLAKKVRVSERRTREAMHRVDPEGILLGALQLTIVNRREYKVPGVLALWHIDGHHKLIRWVCFQPFMHEILITVLNFFIKMIGF